MYLTILRSIDVFITIVGAEILLIDGPLFYALKVVGMQKKQAVLSELENAVKNFDREAAVEAAKKALKIGMDPIEAIEKGLTKGLREVGDLFGKGELFIIRLSPLCS